MGEAVGVVDVDVTCRLGHFSSPTTEVAGVVAVAGAEVAVLVAVQGDSAASVVSAGAPAAVEAQVDHGDRRRC